MLLETRVQLPVGYTKEDVVNLELAIIGVVEAKYPDAPIIFELRSEEYEQRKAAEPDLFDVKPKE